MNQSMPCCQHIFSKAGSRLFSWLEQQQNPVAVQSKHGCKKEYAGICILYIDRHSKLSHVIYIYVYIYIMLYTHIIIALMVDLASAVRHVQTKYPSIVTFGFLGTHQSRETQTCSIKL